MASASAVISTIWTHSLLNRPYVEKWRAAHCRPFHYGAAITNVTALPNGPLPSCSTSIHCPPLSQSTCTLPWLHCIALQPWPLFLPLSRRFAGQLLATYQRQSTPPPPIKLTSTARSASHVTLKCIVCRAQGWRQGRDGNTKCAPTSVLYWHHKHQIKCCHCLKHCVLHIQPLPIDHINGRCMRGKSPWETTSLCHRPVLTYFLRRRYLSCKPQCSLSHGVHWVAFLAPCYCLTAFSVCREGMGLRHVSSTRSKPFLLPILKCCSASRLTEQKCKLDSTLYVCTGNQEGGDINEMTRFAFPFFFMLYVTQYFGNSL